MIARVVKFERESYAGKLLTGDTFERLKRLESLASNEYGEYAGIVIEIAIARYKWRIIPEPTGVMLDEVESNVLASFNSSQSGLDFGSKFGE